MSRSAPRVPRELAGFPYAAGQLAAIAPVLAESLGIVVDGS